MGQKFDVIVVGGGPAGAVCATVCARKGLRVLVIEREKFPRDKVCGDCLNPAAWKVLQRLGMDVQVRSLAHAQLQRLEIATIHDRVFQFPLDPGTKGEIGIRRRDLDASLMRMAQAAGAAFLEKTAVTSIRGEWEIEAGGKFFSAKTLVAADGRNSSVARLLGLMPAQQKDRVGLQTHLPLEAHQRNLVRMQLHPEGYSGGAAIGGDLWNLCLVAKGQQIDALKARAMQLWNLPPNLHWRSLAPLSRRPLEPANGSLFLVGDAARVVEPFTGEGIYYALASGELAGEHIADASAYCRAHAGLYRGRLWVNQLARLAVEHPMAASWMLEHLPAEKILRKLTTKVTQSPIEPLLNEDSASNVRSRPRVFQPSRDLPSFQDRGLFHDAPHETEPSPRPNDVHTP